MELPNNTHSSEAAKQMEFAEGFNPELATGEKLWAAAKFNDLVQSTLLRFAGDAKTYDHTVLTAVSYTHLDVYKRQVQPIVVTPKGDKYLIVAGERRWRAANRANLTEVPCIVRSMSDQNRLEISLIENLQRHDLNALETATAYQKLRDQFNMTLEEIGKRLGGKSISAVSNTLRLLKLPKSVQQALFEGRLNEGQARPLIGLPDDAAEDIMERAIREEWSARRIEQVVTLWKQAKASPIENKRRPADMPHADAIESLSKRFGTGVKIRTNGRGRCV